MLSEIREAAARLSSVLALLDVETLSGTEAREATRLLAAIERRAGAARVLAAGRLAASGVGPGDDRFRDVDAWLASVSGTSVTAARQVTSAGRRAIARPAITDAYERIRDQRALRVRSLPDGARMIEARGPVDRVAQVLAALEPFERERCELDGVGPVPVGVARRLAADSILRAVVTDGVDVTRVAHLGRFIPAHLRTAVETRDRVCVIEGCEVDRHLEIDHNVPVALGGPTSLGNLGRVCTHHHDLKTRRDLRRVGPPGQQRLVPETEHRRNAGEAEQGPPLPVPA